MKKVPGRLSSAPPSSQRYDANRFTFLSFDLYNPSLTCIYGFLSVNICHMMTAILFATLYTKDATLLPTGSNIVKGNEAVREFWAGAIKGMGLKEANLKTVEVVGMGDTVTEMGEYHLKLASGEDRGKYVVVWKSTPEGLKLHWDIWNTNKPTT